MQSGNSMSGNLMFGLKECVPYYATLRDFYRL